MKYKLRDGIVTVSVCGTRLLIPTRKASEDCPGIATLSLFDRLIISQINKGLSVEELYQFFADISFRPVTDVRAQVDAFIDTFVSKGFLVPDEDS